MAPATKKAKTGAALLSEALMREVRGTDWPLKMLAEMAPHALAGPRSQRHAFQLAAGKKIEACLMGEEDRRRQKAEEAAAALSAMDRTPREAAQAEAETKLKAAKEEATAKKAGLVQRARAFRATRAAMQQAVAEHRDFEKEADKVQQLRDEAKHSVEDLLPLLSKGSIDAKASAELLTFLTPEGRFEESIVTAVKAMLTKLERPAGAAQEEQAPALGEFDKLALLELQRVAAEQLESLDKAVAARSENRQARASKMEAAKAEFEAAAEAQKVAAQAWVAANKQQEEYEQATTAASKAIKSFQTEFNKLKRKADSLQADLELFQDGTLTNFKKLETDDVTAADTATPADAPADAAPTDAADAPMAAPEAVTA